MKFSKILIIRLNSIGDVLLTTPILKTLKDFYKNVFIGFVVAPKSYQVIKNNPYIDKIFIFDKSQSLKKIKSFIFELRKEKFEVVIDLHNVMSSSLLAIFSNAKYKIGDSKQLLTIFFNKRIKTKGRKAHIVENYLELVKPVGITIIEKKPNIKITSEDYNFANNFLEKHRIKQEKLIGINPFASWKTNLWSIHNYVEVIDYLNNHNFTTLIFGQDENNPYLKQIISSLKTKSFSAIGKTNLTQLAALIQKCKVLVTPDTGPMHIATAVGTKVIALFGPCSPIFTGPLGKNNIVIKKDIPCSPCFKKRCEDNICMKKISVEDVINYVLASMTISS